MDAHESVDLGILDDLLGEVHEDALRERDEEPLAGDAASIDNDGDGEMNGLSPDDMLRQLDAVTLANDDDDDLDPVAAFEDAHDELQSVEDVEEDDSKEAATSALDEQLTRSTDLKEENGGADADDMGVVDALSDFHDPTDGDADASDVHVSDAADDASVAPILSSVAESNESAAETAMAIVSTDNTAAPAAEEETELSGVAANDDDERNVELGTESHQPLADWSVEATPSSLETPHVESALDTAAMSIEDSSVDDIDSEDRSVLTEVESPHGASVEPEVEGVDSLLLRSSRASDASSADAPTIHTPLDTSDPNGVLNNNDRLEAEAVESQATTESPAPDETLIEPTASCEEQKERHETERQEQEGAIGSKDAVQDDAHASESGDDAPIQAPPLHDEQASDSPVLPPPAPTSFAVVVGSMIPSADDDDSDSQDEDDDTSKHAAPPSPLHLDADDDDDDVLEVDPAVVEAIQGETKDATSHVSATHDKDESALLAALPPLSKPLASSTDEIEFSFTDEIRVAHATVPHAAVDAFDRKQQQQQTHESQDTDSSSVDAFGISYTSFKTKSKTTRGDGTDVTDGDGYALPAAPTFPDEREFERELALSSDLVFSVKSSMRSDATPATETQNGDDDDDDGDEFSAVAAFDTNEFSVDALQAKRASLEARTTEDEARVLQELKRATDAEKALNDAAPAAAVSLPLDSGAAASALRAPVPEPESAMSLRELHGIYKRGLGDQSVLLLDDDDNGDSSRDEKAAKATSAPTSSNSASGTPLSVMGRILSKPSLTTHAITEEVGEDDDDDDGNGGTDRTKCTSDDYGGAHDPHREGETLIDNGGARNSSDRGSTSGADEWKEIQLATQSSTSAATASSGPSPLTAVSFRISYAEALAYCLEDDAFLLQRDKIVPEEFAESGRSCFACFSPRPRLAFAGALDERDRVFCIAATSYAPQNDVFTRVLQTLYAKLTRTQRAVPLSGSHWEDIGFQGNDPSTDLRGCGVLSLVQMLYLVETYPELVLRAHSLSHHPTRHFPLACVLINVTLQCVTALRTGALYKECNKQASVFRAINTLYVALTAELMDEIQSSADEIPVILQSVLEDGRSHPDSVIDEFAKTNNSHGGKRQQAGLPAPSHKQHKRSSGGARDAGATIEFTEIALQSTASDGDDE